MYAITSPYINLADIFIQSDLQFEKVSGLCENQRRVLRAKK